MFGEALAPSPHVFLPFFSIPVPSLLTSAFDGFKARYSMARTCTFASLSAVAPRQSKPFPTPLSSLYFRPLFSWSSGFRIFNCIRWLSFPFSCRLCGCRTSRIGFPLCQILFDKVLESTFIPVILILDESVRALDDSKVTVVTLQKFNRKYLKPTEACAKLSRIVCMYHPHRDVNSAGVAFKKYSIQKNEYEYRCGSFSVTVPDDNRKKRASREAALESAFSRRARKQIGRALLVKGRYKLSPETTGSMNQSTSADLKRISLVIKSIGPALMPREINVQRSMANRTETIGLTDRDFVVHVECITACAFTFEVKCAIKFSEPYLVASKPC